MTITDLKIAPAGARAVVAWRDAEGVECSVIANRDMTPAEDIFYRGDAEEVPLSSPEGEEAIRALRLVAGRIVTLN